MLTRILAAIGVGVWCIFILLVSVVFVIDRGLADVGVVWVAVLGIGVAAPVLLMRQINRAITAHEESRRSVPGTREKEKELLGVLEERGGLTPSLTQFLDLVEFYVLRAPHRDGAKPDEDLRAQGIAAVSRALALPLYHVAAAQDLIARMQPRMRRKR